MSVTAQDYDYQLQLMVKKAALWRKQNPDRKVMVQFNIPPKVFFVALISDAIKNGFVSTNEAGLELIKSLWSWDDRTEPTVMMVRIVLEHKV